MPFNRYYSHIKLLHVDWLSTKLLGDSLERVPPKDLPAPYSGGTGGEVNSQVRECLVRLRNQG